MESARPTLTERAAYVLEIASLVTKALSGPVAGACLVVWAISTKFFYYPGLASKDRLMQLLDPYCLIVYLGMVLFGLLYFGADHWHPRLRAKRMPFGDWE